MTPFPPYFTTSARPLIVAAFLLTLLVVIANASGVPTLTAPFSATCALLALLPKAPFSQPKTIFFSHIICIGVGVAMALLPFAMPVLVLVLLATWISIALMALFRSVHAPAVAHAAILGLGKQSVGEYAFWALVVTLSFTVIAYMTEATSNKAVEKISAPKA